VPFFFGDAYLRSAEVFQVHAFSLASASRWPTRG
jgi:hypothetical protein